MNSDTLTRVQRRIAAAREIIASQAIDEAVRKLRTQSGWWNGDVNARAVLNELIKKIR